MPLGLGLRDGWQGPNTVPDPDAGQWLTRDRLAEMKLTCDPEGRVRLARTNAVGQTLEWVFDPHHAYALVSHCRRDAQPPYPVIDEVAATDFKIVNGQPLPFTILSRRFGTGGREIERWRATVTKYTLADKANTPAHYQLTWPAGMTVADRRAGMRLKADANGHLPKPPPAPLAADEPRSATSPDESTPKGATKQFIEAVIRSDRSAARHLLVDDARATAEQLDALLEEADARHALERATISKFGADAPSKLPKSPFALFLQRLDQAVVRIDGDRATVSGPRDPEPAVHLVKVADGWRITQLPGDGPTMIRSALAMAEVANRLASEIAEGKLTSMGEVVRQLQARYAARIQR
jgi:hypothetical protein